MEIDFMNFIVIVNFVLDISIILFIGYIYLEPDITSYFSPDNPHNITDCENQSIIEASECAKEYVGEFYYYNESNQNKDLDFETLKKEGGVCWHYSKLYSDIGKDLGFYVKEVTMDIDNKSSHRVAIWSNNEAYCILDQSIVRCVKLNV